MLGIWWQETEGAKFWLAVLNDLRHRGVEDVPVCCVDGLAGFSEAIEAVVPRAWVQCCIVHQIRSSMRYVTYQERKRVAQDPKPIYRAVNAEAAEAALEDFEEKWSARYPMIAESWRVRWENITPPSIPARAAQSGLHDNSIENLNRQIRKAIKTRGHFPDEQAATKLICLAIERAERSGKEPSTGQQLYEVSRSTSETDYLTDNRPALHTEVRTASWAAAPARPTPGERCGGARHGAARAL